MSTQSELPEMASNECEVYAVYTFTHLALLIDENIRYIAYYLHQLPEDVYLVIIDYKFLYRNNLSLIYEL